MELLGGKRKEAQIHEMNVKVFQFVTDITRWTSPYANVINAINSNSLAEAEVIPARWAEYFEDLCMTTNQHQSEERDDTVMDPPRL